MLWFALGGHMVTAIGAGLIGYLASETAGYYFGGVLFAVGGDQACRRVFLAPAPADRRVVAGGQVLRAMTWWR